MYDQDLPKLVQWKNDTQIFRKTAGGVIAKIDADIDNYQKAFSNMAKRNVLNSLSQLIVSWEKIQYSTVSGHVAVKALKEIIAKKLRELGALAHKYSQVTLIGWERPCSTMTGDYFRFVDKDSGDQQGKCHEMMHAIESARNNVVLNGDNDSTLKIFMAPEFYFRGAKGAYSYDLVADIIPTMKKLGTENGIYEHWLFVFGTAVAASEDTQTFCTVCLPPNNLKIKFVKDPKNPAKTIPQCMNNPAHATAEGSYGNEVQNVALIQKGQDTHMVVKEYVSGIDYKADQVTVTVGQGKSKTDQTNWYVPPAGSSQSRFVSKFKDERMGGGIFTIDGITFGMEICLDHSHTSATPNSGGRLAPYADTIQILLIPSFGMTIGTGLYCVNGGIVFNVDGQNAGSSDLKVKGHVGPPVVRRDVAPQKASGKLGVWGPLTMPHRI